MLCFPNCKINLGLYVTRKRKDGYHDIETVFYPLPAVALAKEGLSAVASAKAEVQLRDVLEVAPAKKARLHTSGIAIAGKAADNLVWKAYQLLSEKFPGQVRPLAIYLHKIIPMGAGLGGGSADGAFMLRLLNDYCGLGLSKQQLVSYALALGSDCPFYIYNTPQFATGRGEKMHEIPVDLSDYSIQVICPQLPVSTAKAFSMITPKPAAYDLRQLYKLPVREWKSCITNDFEIPVSQQHPELASIKEQLYEQGALFASMSGSGSAVYGIFPKNGRAEIKLSMPCDVFYLQ